MNRKKKSSGSGRIRLMPSRRFVAGIDIGSTEHWVCGPEQDDGEREVRQFGTTTPELHRMVAWLQELQVESVAMESTYVYWIPVYEVLEAAGIEPVLVNARTLKNVPGRKTDMADCQWLQLLHACGLLRGSFRPSGQLGRLRALTRERSSYSESQKRWIHHMQKALDQMNVLVHRAVTDITGTTGMAIIRAIVEGERDPHRLATLRHPRCRQPEEKIAEFLTGTWHEEHLFNLEMALRMYDDATAIVAEYDARLDVELQTLQPEDREDEPCPPHPNRSKAKTMKTRGELPLRETLWRVAGVDLTTIDGIGAENARTILTEIGFDIAKFPTEKHFVSWLRLCPRVAVSGGKPLKKRRNGMGASRLAAVFRNAAVTLSRSKSALGAAYRRQASRHSGARAVFVIARKLATLVYRMLRFGAEYVDVGQVAYEARYQLRRRLGLERSAAELGLALVPLQPTG